MFWRAAATLFFPEKSECVRSFTPKKRSYKRSSFDIISQCEIASGSGELSATTIVGNLSVCKASQTLIRNASVKSAYSGVVLSIFAVYIRFGPE